MKPLLCFALFSVLLFNGLCLADTNLQTGSQCSEADYSLNEDTFLPNLRTTMDSLASNVVTHQGFFQTHVGTTKTNQVFGSVLCRGDISATNCSNCILNSIKVASDDCPNSRDVSVWFRWCFLRYSNQSFFGVMTETSMAIANDTDLDEAKVVSEGLGFMSGVAASASEKEFMFDTGVLNVSESGVKRYGMAQCTRDIEREECGKCLDAQLGSFRTVIGNKRRWEIYGSNCFMWYNDYQFYSDVSTLLSAARRPCSLRRFTIWIAIGVLAILLMVL